MNRKINQLQLRLVAIFQDSTTPQHEWLAAIRKLEKDAGIPEGKINFGGLKKTDIPNIRQYL